MTNYEKNINAMQSSKDYLYTRMKDRKDYSNHNNKLDEISIANTRDGNTSINLNFRASNYRLNSLYNPLQEAQRWSEQFDMKNIGIVAVLFGMGNGICVRELLKRLKDNILLIYEPCADIFFHVLNNYDITDILTAPNVSLTVEGINDNEIRNLLSNQVSWINLKSQIICVHPQYDTIFTESVEIFYKIILDNNNRAVVNKNTDVAISRVTINNTLINLKYIRKCNLVTDLIGKFDEEVPAIIVAAGPSLDKNIEELKFAKGKAVIFAVDTAVKYLLAHNIKPDFIVTLDPSKSLHHLQDERCQDIPIFCRIDSRPENIGNNNKKIILYNIEGYIKNIYSKLGKNTGILNSGGSVATGAFCICETIGFKRIILVGQDLAYAGDNTHAGGIQVDVGGAGKFIEMVEDIYGNLIKTRYDWYVYIRWFEDAVDLFEGEEVIDATEGGAKIKGTTILTLRDTIEMYCAKKVDCDRIISSLEPTIGEQEVIRIREFISQDILDLSIIKSKAKEAKALCEKLINKYEKSLLETSSSITKNKQLGELNNFMEQKDVYELVDWDIAAETSEQLSDLYVYTENEKQDKLAPFVQGKVIYSAMEDSIERITPMLEDSLQYFS